MIIGVDLGGTNIRAGIEHKGNVLHARKELFNTKGSLDETLAQLIGFIRPLVHPEIMGLGIGVPSVVDVQRGIVYHVANIPSWEEVPLKKILEDEFRIPVNISNDANCFVLGEHRFGVLKGFKNVVGISCGTGLGCGIIINNRLYEGSNCGAGEVGLLSYLDHTIEYYASGNLFRACFNTTAREAHQHAREGDAEALRLWKEYGMHLSQAIKSVLYTYDPEAIVLGGSLSQAYPFFSESMFASLQNFAYPESIRRLKIFQSQNESITLLGAAALISANDALISVI